MVFCYLIQTHTDPLQILRLVETIRRLSPEGRILVVHDATRTPLDPAPFLGIPAVDLLQRNVPVERSYFSMLLPLLEGIERLVERGRGDADWDFDWLVFLTGQDYPTRPLRELEASLASTQYDGFLSFWGIEPGAPGSPWRPRQGGKRYLCQYVPLPAWTRGPLAAIRFLEKVSPLRFFPVYGPRIGWRPGKTPFDGPFRCYGGRPLWTLSRPCIEEVRRFLRERPDVVDWFRRTASPEEALFHTALVNAGRFKLCPDDRRYTDYRGTRDGHPRTLGRADFETIASGAYDFARKFDTEKDSGILDLLDEKVLGLR